MASAPLYPAVINGDLDRVRSLIIHTPGVDVNVRGRSQLVPLHHAAKKNFVEIVEFLLTHPLIDVNAGDKIQRTPLHMACRKGHTKVVELLLKSIKDGMGDINAQAKGGITSLHLAAYCGNDEAVKMLVAHQEIDLDAKTTEEEFTALHLCASSGYERILKLLLDAYNRAGRTEDKMRAVINAQDVVKRTPLHYAVCDGRVEVVKELLSSPLLDENFADRDGCTALHLAAWKGNEEIVSLLLQHPQIDPNVAATKNTQETQKKIVEPLQQKLPLEQLPRPKLEDYVITERRSKVTPLHYAVDGDHVNVVSALVEHPLTELLLENSQRKSALDIALQNKQKEILVLILERVWVDKFDICGKLLKVVLHKKGYEEMMKVLLLEIENGLQAHNGDIPPDKIDVSPIHRAAYAGFDRLLEVLLDVPNQDINAEDSDSQTPLHFATIAGHTNVVKVLIARPSLRANDEDKYSRTALQIAVESERKDIEKLLLERLDVKDYVDRLYRDRQVYVDAANAILVGAALIASVTFAGWLQPPLGYTPYYEFLVPDPAPPGTYESYASVKQHISTRVFWVCNSLSFFSAIATVIAGAGAVLPMLDVFIGEEVRVVRRSLVLTSILLVFAVVFVLGAFGAAGFASLPPIIHLQVNMIVTCTIGVLLCVIILGWFLRRLYRIRPSWWRTLENTCLIWHRRDKEISTAKFFYISASGSSSLTFAL